MDWLGASRVKLRVFILESYRFNMEDMLVTPRILEVPLLLTPFANTYGQLAPCPMEPKDIDFHNDGFRMTIANVSTWDLH